MTQPIADYPTTDRTQVRRLKKRASYDRAAIHRILDDGRVAHIGFVARGAPVVIPTLYARDSEVVYIHGSGASRMLNALSEGIDVCLTVTLTDGLVLARSAFHHSMNYRSVVLFGKAYLVQERKEILRALESITNHVVPNRWQEVRAPNELELRQTKVLRLPIEEVSAKIRSGGPIDDAEDYSLPVWAGVVPIVQTFAAPIADSRLHPDAPRFDLRRFERE